MQAHFFIPFVSLPINKTIPPARINLIAVGQDRLLYVITIYHSQWCNWQRQRDELPPWQAKCKNRFPTYFIFWFRIPLLLVGCCFCVFFRFFSGDLGFWFNHPRLDSLSFLKFFLSVGWWILYNGQWAPLTLSIAPWLNPLLAPLIIAV